ncbi:MAG: CHAT domain-containing protein [Desulfobacteraceae bacterium]|nr:CHAT domain-containing protein [Desulfobacteraceae bacterium]
MMIENNVEYYKDPPNTPIEFRVPRKQYTDEELNNVYKGVKETPLWAEPRFYATWAYDEFLLGNLSLSLRLVDLGIIKSMYLVNNLEGFAYKALILAEAGDYNGAELALSSAKGFYQKYKNNRGDRGAKGRQLLAEVYITHSKAAIYFARGDLTAAEQEYRQLISDIDIFRRSGSLVAEPTTHQPEAMVNLARVLLAQGRAKEAEIYVREAIQSGHANIMPVAFITLSKIFFAQRRFEDAKVCARTALHITMSLRAPIDAFIRANIRADYARALLALGQYKEALQQFNLIKQELKTDPETFNRRFKGSGEWGLALLMNGDAPAAIEKLEFAAWQSEKILGTNTYALSELRALHAMALTQYGQPDAALKAFEQHVPELFKKRKSTEVGIHSKNARFFKFKLILEAYIALLAESGKPGDAEKSFQYASALQNKQIGRAVALSSARTAVKDPALADLIRLQQDLEKKLSAFKNRLANALYAPPELINTEVIAELRNQIETLNRATESLEKEIKMLFPNYANIINPDNIDVAKVRNALDDTEALISIFTGKKYTFIWAISKTGPVRLGKIRVGKNEMTGIVNRLRKALDPGEAFGILELSSFDLGLAYNLYEQILKPVELGWKQAKNLLVVTQGPMGQIPLSILPTTSDFQTVSAPGKPVFSNYREVKWLIKTHSVTVLPSVSALVNLRSIVPVETERVAYAGFGDPYFNQEQLAEAKNEAKKVDARVAMRNAPILMRGIRVTQDGALDKKKIASIDIAKLNRLPDTREEVINIATTLKADTEKDVFIGKQASEQTIKSLDLSNRRVVVFATHGLVPGDLNGLDQPALAFSAPDVTGNVDEDGLLTMGEIMGLRLNADWVVLSACNSGAAEGEGAEAMSGLGQAFFYAGARSLLVTSWPVETISAKILTTDLFKRQLDNPGINRAEALRLTMNAMILMTHKQGFSYAHPIFWAPYGIVGDSRR